MYRRRQTICLNFSCYFLCGLNDLFIFCRLLVNRKRSFYRLNRFRIFLCENYDKLISTPRSEIAYKYTCCSRKKNNL